MSTKPVPLELRKTIAGGFEAAVLLSDGEEIIGDQADSPADALWELSQRLEQLGQELVAELLANDRPS